MIVKGEIEYLVEYCSGSMSIDAVHKQWARKYQGESQTVLAVAGSDSRHDALVEMVRHIDAPIYVSTLREVLNDPAGDIWVDGNGEVFGLE